jgi:hypothetical protein
MPFYSTGSCTPENRHCTREQLDPELVRALGQCGVECNTVSSGLAIACLDEYGCGMHEAIMGAYYRHCRMDEGVSAKVAVTFEDCSAVADMILGGQVSPTEVFGSPEANPGRQLRPQ